MELRRMIILFGPPGSGKGLLGDRLVEELNLTKISTGDILRREIKDDTPLGIKITRQVKSGILVADKIVNQIVARRLAETTGDVLLDGYPRRSPQFAFLHSCVKDFSKPLCVVLNTNLDVILNRIQQRRICEICGTTHFASQGCCPKCGGRSVIREDDALIRKRIRSYLKETEPILYREMLPWCTSLSVDGLQLEESLQAVLNRWKQMAKVC